MNQTSDMSPLAQVEARRQTGQKPTRAKLSAADRADLAELRNEKVEWVDDPVFYELDAERKVYDQAVEMPDPNTTWYHPVMDNATSPKQVEGVVNVVLDKHQERAVFLQFNYARYRWVSIFRQADQAPLDDEQTAEMLYWYRKSREMRDRIAQYNLALVLAMAKRVRGNDLDFGDLISEGNMALLRAIDKFDLSKGFKFSTYACRAILKAFSRSGMKHTRYKQMFPTDFDPALERSDYNITKNLDHEGDCATQVRHLVENNKADLSDVEQAVIEHRFALKRQQETGRPLTLEQVGKLVGLTKERVRQIQNKALEKLRITLEEQFLDGSPHHRREELEDDEAHHAESLPESEPENTVRN